MPDSPETRLSRFLSLVLRHKPETVGLTLSKSGWADVQQLLKGLKNSGRNGDLAFLQKVVAEDEKGRYEFSEDGRSIRASQGHSLKIELGYQPETPPDKLYHGTPYRFIDSIKATGLSKQQRHAVHLSPSKETAAAVGNRRGKAVILTIDTKQMAADGHKFFKSTNGVWLTESVPTKYINFHENEPVILPEIE